jgi:hypothetical protein
MYIALGLSGCVALFALAAYLIGDYAAARSSAMTACIVFAFTCITGLAARKGRSMLCEMRNNPRHFTESPRREKRKIVVGTRATAANFIHHLPMWSRNIGSSEILGRTGSRLISTLE